jgi:hypothetical protein
MLAGEEGKGRGGEQGVVGEGHAPAAATFILVVRQKKEDGRRKREEKKRKEKKRDKKEKNMENFPNLKIFGEKNKRQFMKLVKIIFVQERNNPNYN